MSMKYEISRFPVAQPSRLLATNGGAHILSCELSTDAWNGAIIGLGDYLGFEYYEEVEPTEFEAVVVDKMASGGYLVEVTKADNAWLVYNPPVVEAEWTNDFKQEKNFYLKAGVDMARCHQLTPHDIFELSADGFEGADVYVGATISGVSGKKPVVEASV